MKTRCLKQIVISCFYLNIEYRHIPSTFDKAKLFIKIFLGTLILMTQASLYLFPLLELI